MGKTISPKNQELKNKDILSKVEREIQVREDSPSLQIDAAAKRKRDEIKIQRRSSMPESIVNLIEPEVRTGREDQ